MTLYYVKRFGEENCYESLRKLSIMPTYGVVFDRRLDHTKTKANECIYRIGLFRLYTVTTLNRSLCVASISTIKSDSRLLIYK